MTDAQYLDAVLRDHTLTTDDPDLQALLGRTDEVQQILRQGLTGHGPAFNKAGSFAKQTMIKDAYDVDLTVYFARGTGFADTLEGIYEGVEEILQEDYITERNRSSIKLLVPGNGSGDNYTNIDVVPGRFVGGDNGDVFLHQTEGDKERLQTNLEKHVSTILKCGVRPAIRLMKVWRERRGLDFKTFVLELLVVDILAGLKAEPLDVQLLAVFNEFAHRIDTLTVVDPANSNNDLSEIFDDTVKEDVGAEAFAAIQAIGEHGWTAVFGGIDADARVQALRRAAPAVAAAPARGGYRPWARGY